MEEQQLGESLTAEEQAALSEMEADEVVLEEPKEATTEAPAEEGKTEETPEAKEPEFKSVREDKPPEGFVPHQAMHAERLKRQEAEAKYAALEARLAKLETPEEAPPQWVDPLEDPEAHRKWSEWNLQQTNKKIEDFQQQQAAQQKQLQETREVAEYEAQFKATTPDYSEAVQFLVDTRANELRGYGYDDATIRNQISVEARGLFEASKAAGLNPAQLVYLRAQEAGWKKPQPKPAEPAQRMAALSEAQKNTQGLGSTGAPAQGQLTVEQLADMSEAELAKLSEDQIRAVMGG